MRLPDFPWDQLAAFREKARAHPYGLVDLSVGTPVDSTPAVVQQALAGAADAPGYPQTVGTPDLREAAAGWLARRLGVLVDPGAVLPVLGTKELVAQLPGQLGLEPGDRVWVPTPAYPTYEVGALLARCEPVVGPAEGVTMVWLNSPGNPTGRVMTVEEMRAVVGWARERGVIVASDECYIELGWEARPVSVLHPDVCGGSHEGLLAVHSLSKRSNLAGYRAGFVTGDPHLVAGLLAVRKHAGFMMPTPVQAAMTAAYADDLHVADQRARYANRRAVLAAALSVAGFTIDHSEAGLYLWATRGEDAWATLDALAGVGVLVAPGTFYGEAGRQHVRVALTAPDSQVATVPERMTMIPPAAAPSHAGAHQLGAASAQPAAGGYPPGQGQGGGGGGGGGYPAAAQQQAGYGPAAGYPHTSPTPVPYEPAPGYDTQRGQDPRPSQERDPRTAYDARPSGYEARPGAYEMRPAGYENRPDAYDTRPNGYETGPGGYESGPASGYGAQPGSGYEGQSGDYEQASRYHALRRRPGQAKPGPGGYGADPADRYDRPPARSDEDAAGTWRGEPDIR
ncbi:succinyldiaminopimelate transaminase [Frankia sp. AgB32]|uniref:succinyldiaminopimelate transaminase n=1 Tax=Frankia sp. AgB32 TaxID=631119 RepID=UPI00200F514D|nr:succinyldiaminopimelate transaminase [Frankia sp. AgB32]MCK9893703.1 succinyldiaminopimelate transaminase [Frankia sp. AgB32]